MKNHNLKTRKNGVLKDIEEWINEKHKKEGESDFDDFMNRSSHKDSRMSGQLPENVTEERMLKSHLLELGNERYKFLSRFAFEKQQFQDKKVKRINAMKARIMSASTASAPGRLGSSYSRQSMISEKSDLRALPSRARTVHFMPSQTMKDKSRILKTSTPMDSRGKDHNIFRSGARFAKINKFSKFGGSIPSKTDDPRYSFLEKALSPAYTDGRNKQSVREIVKSIESLHRLPGLGLSKIDIGAKIQEYMKECEMSFSVAANQQMVVKRLTQ